MATTQCISMPPKKLRKPKNPISATLRALDTSDAPGLPVIIVQKKDPSDSTKTIAVDTILAVYMMIFDYWTIINYTNPLTMTLAGVWATKQFDTMFIWMIKGLGTGNLHFGKKNDIAKVLFVELCSEFALKDITFFEFHLNRMTMTWTTLGVFAEHFSGKALDKFSLMMLDKMQRRLIETEIPATLDGYLSSVFTYPVSRAIFKLWVINSMKNIKKDVTKTFAGPAITKYTTRSYDDWIVMFTNIGRYHKLTKTAYLDFLGLIEWFYVSPTWFNGYLREIKNHYPDFVLPATLQAGMNRRKDLVKRYRNGAVRVARNFYWNLKVFTDKSARKHHLIFVPYNCGHKFVCYTTDNQCVPVIFKVKIIGGSEFWINVLNKDGLGITANNYSKVVHIVFSMLMCNQNPNVSSFDLSQCVAVIDRKKQYIGKCSIDLPHHINIRSGFYVVMHSLLIGPRPHSVPM